MRRSHRAEAAAQPPSRQIAEYRFAAAADVFWSTKQNSRRFAAEQANIQKYENTKIQESRSGRTEISREL